MPGERVGVLLPGPADFPAWRAAARRLLGGGVPPERVEWSVAGEAPGLFAAAPAAEEEGLPVRVPRRFLGLAELALRHRAPARFALLYRLLWRLARDRSGLPAMAADPDLLRAEAMARAVRRDAHRMHAFLRFRRVETADGPRYLAWFEPEHHILEAEAGFFLRRFAALRWSIVTPEASLHWDGAALRLGPGGRRCDVPAEDAQDALWRTYYAAVFNPARLRPAAMRAGMPRRYWANLAEAREIPRLIAEAPRRAAAMAAQGAVFPRRPQPARPWDVAGGMPPDLPDRVDDPAAALAALREELRGRNDLPPWAAQATQPVFGEGPPGAPLMFVGEQPGDEEDLAGRPFVGPAGRMLDRALEAVGIARKEAYVTNAVKHFKFRPAGRRRLHQSPDAGDIAWYRPFLKREIALVGPRLLVTLGATALRAVTGRPLAIGKVRGGILRTEEGLPLLPTIHPSYLLRLPDPESREREYARFLADLRQARREVA
jgi:probable DNA metabolism protein